MFKDFYNLFYKDLFSFLGFFYFELINEEFFLIDKLLLFPFKGLSFPLGEIYIDFVTFFKGFLPTLLVGLFLYAEIDFKELFKDFFFKFSADCIFVGIFAF